MQSMPVTSMPEPRKGLVADFWQTWPDRVEYMQFPGDEKLFIRSPPLMATKSPWFSVTRTRIQIFLFSCMSA